jgi:hypothetical protein
MWCDYHKSGTHTNAQCSAQGGTPPPSFFQKQKGKANTAQTISQSSLQQSTNPTASAQLANVDYNSDGSAFNTYINCVLDIKVLLLIQVTIVFGEVVESSTVNQATIISSLILAHLTIWSTLLLCLPIYNRYHL